MTDILFLTRGHGFGHAARDLHIIRELRRRPDTTVRIMANGSAVTYYGMRDIACTPIDVPDNDFGKPAAMALWQCLAKVPRPDLVISDEMLWALPFAQKVWHRPCVMLLCALWVEFGMPQADQFFDAAHDVVVLDFARNRRESYGTTAPIGFLGPLIQQFAVDRAAARARLGIAATQQVAVLSLGGMTTRPESRRMAAAAIAAWRGHAPRGSRLLVLADRPSDAGPEDTEVESAEVDWVGPTAEPETYYRAADVVFNDAMGSAVCDLAWNGIPTVALLDEESTRTFPQTFVHRVEQLTASGLIETVPLGEGPGAIWRAAERARAAANRPDRAEALAGFDFSTSEQVARRLYRPLDAET